MAVGIGWEIKMTDGILKLLGLNDSLGGLWLATGFYVGDRAVNFAQQQHKPLMIHLEQINTVGNCLDGVPSSLLSMVGARYSNFGDIETAYITQPEFKRLQSGIIYELDASIRDLNSKRIDNHSLPICITLEIRED